MKTYEFGFPPYCNNPLCNHSESWHHANMKKDGVVYTCYGIGCTCINRFDDSVVRPSTKDDLA